MGRVIQSVALCVLVLALAGSGRASSQESDQDLRAEIEALKQGQQQILKDVQAIKKILEDATRKAAPAGPQVAGKVFSVSEHAIKGESTAKLTLVEFTDYQ